MNFYPRSPCGERHYSTTCKYRRAYISIHALLAESDSPVSLDPAVILNFYPRSPCGERPTYVSVTIPTPWISIHALLAESDRHLSLRCTHRLISIHALLAESDHQPQKRDLPAGYFYPRSPCGERPRLRCHDHRQDVDFYPRSPCGERPPRACPASSPRHFYPRSPCGERPGPRPFLGTWALISIHALLAESDCWAPRTPGPNPYFYPRSPCGERPGASSWVPLMQNISIHALLAESDSKSAQNSGALLRI